jgi:hypothetical protein
MDLEVLLSYFTDIVLQTEATSWILPLECMLSVPKQTFATIHIHKKQRALFYRMRSAPDRSLLVAKSPDVPEIPLNFETSSQQ